MRSLMNFDCEGARLGASLDDAASDVGLLIVTGGGESRIGAHRGLRRLAAATASAGFPTFRFDRRGVGDSEGDDAGFSGSAPDIAAALEAFRGVRPDLRLIIAFGLCDGATALALHGRDLRLDGLILSNPWIVEPPAGLPPAAAIRRRYLERLLSVDGWRRLLTGRMDYRAAARGLRSLSRKVDQSLATRFASSLDDGAKPVTIVLAAGDATAIAFTEAWRGQPFRRLRASDSVAFVTIETSSHSFADGDDPDRLAAACISSLQKHVR